MKTVLTIIGTRPEAIKQAPLILELQKSKKLKPIICLTGQQQALAAEALSHFNLKADVDVQIKPASYSLSHMAATLFHKLDEVIQRYAPNYICVQGDTTTACIGAQTAHYNQIPLIHLEAGLRTHNLAHPFPEEGHRKIISQLADLHFCPTKQAVENLKVENIHENVFLVGNTGIDALKLMREQMQEILHVQSETKILVSCHRRENRGMPLNHLCEVLKQLLLQGTDLKIDFLLQPNPQQRKIVTDRLAGLNNLSLHAPLSYKEVIHKMLHAHLLITDSGGMIEEASFLGLPSLIYRRHTEREEAIQEGVAHMLKYEPQEMKNQISAHLKDAKSLKSMCQPSLIYGDGESSKDIVSIVEESLI